jgi:hypothetical protein
MEMISDSTLQDTNYGASEARRRGPRKPVNPIIATETISKLLKTCYELDEHICGTTPASKLEIQSWRDEEVVTYLTSGSHLAQWESDLGVLCQKYLAGAFTPDIFEKTLMRILPVVEKLEYCRTALLDELEEGDGVGFMKLVCEAVEKRCMVIERAFNELEGRRDAQTIG